MKNKFKIKTGVIGTGSMGQNHARIYNEISNLIGIYDINISASSLVAERFNVSVFENLSDFFDSVDAISIATPTSTHFDIAKEAISKGKHVLIEKPITSTLSQANEIIRLANEREIVLSVGHIERFNPVITFIKEKLEAEEWGDLISLSSKRLSNYPYRIRDVGVVHDIAIHDIDIFNYLVGKQIKKISASGSSFVKNNEDNASIILTFNNSVNGIIEANWLTPMKVRQLSITCSKAYIEADYIKQEVIIQKLNKVDIKDNNLWDIGLDINKNIEEITKQEPLKLELIDFLMSVSKNKKPLVRPKEAAYNLEIADKIVKLL